MSEGRVWEKNQVREKEKVRRERGRGQEGQCDTRFQVAWTSEQAQYLYLTEDETDLTLDLCVFMA